MAINLHKALKISILKKITKSKFKNDSQGKSTKTNSYISLRMRVI